MGSDEHLKVYLREEINVLIDNPKIIREILFPSPFFFLSFSLLPPPNPT
jgi:hypothetical protein